MIAAFGISLFLGHTELEALSVFSKLAQVGLEGVLLALLWGAPQPTPRS